MSNCQSFVLSAKIYFCFASDEKLGNSFQNSCINDCGTKSDLIHKSISVKLNSYNLVLVNLPLNTKYISLFVNAFQFYKFTSIKQ